MMEFTYSRAALMVCGVILMASFAVPLASIWDADHDEEMQCLAQKDAKVIDTFWNTGVDELILNGDSMLPSAEYSLTVSGMLLTITGPDGRDYTAGLRTDSGEFRLSYGETYSLYRF